jgi:hypothetical protein
MKQRAHAWTAFRALKLLDDAKAAPELVKLLAFYLSDVWEGAWLPDTLIVDMSYGHTFKMDSDPAMLEADISTESWLKTSYAELKTKLGSRRLCLDLAKDSPELEKPYRSHRDKGGDLPNRVLALSHSVSDMLKMADYPLAFYAKKKEPDCFAGDISGASVKDLSSSPNFSARQIAITLFMMSHYITDAHMPLHCDLRDFGADDSPTRRLPRTLHPSIEEVWEQHFPSKDNLELNSYSLQSLDNLVKFLPLNTMIKIDTDPQYALGDTVPGCEHDEWQTMVNICRASYALSRTWLDITVQNARELVNQKGLEDFEQKTNAIFHDAVLTTASIWLKAWKKFVG